MNLEVKPGQQIKASQFNALAASVSQRVGAADAPFRGTAHGMLINGGIGKYESKAQSQVDKLFQTRVGKGVYPSAYTKGGQQFYGAFVNVGEWENIFTFGAVDGQNKLPYCIEAVYVSDTGTGLESGSDLICVWVAGGDGSADHPVFDDASNIWIPVSEMQVADDGSVSGGDVDLYVLQLFNYSPGHRALNGSVVLVLGDDTVESVEDLRGKIQNSRRVAPFSRVDDVRILYQARMLTPRRWIMDDSPPLTQPTQFVDGAVQLVPYPDSDVSSLLQLNSVETTDPRQVGIRLRDPYGRNSWSYSLHNFGRFEPDFYDLPLSDEIQGFDVILRRKEPHPRAEDLDVYADRAKAEVVYMPLSALAPGTVDSELPPVMLSSIQTRQDEDSGKEYHQMFGFDQEGIPYSDVSARLSDVEVVIRESATLPQGSRVNYIPLSALVADSGTVDSKLPALQLSSIQDEVDEDGQKYHQLFNFQNDGIGNFQISDLRGYEFAIRDSKTDPNGKIVNYLELSSFVKELSSDVLSSLSSTVDSDIPALALSSIQDEVDEDGQKYHQLYNFQNDGIGDVAISDMQGYEVVVRDSKTDPNGKIVNYLNLSSVVQGISIEISNTLSSLSGTVDSKIPALTLSSIQDMTLPDGTKYHQLYNFQNPGMGAMPISALSGIEMVVRDAKTNNNNGKIVNYLDLQGFSNSIATTVIADIKLSAGTVDSKLTDLHLSSIQDMRDSDDKEYHQMFNFQNPSLSTFQISDCNDFDFVVRDKKTMPAQGGQGNIVNYINLSSFVNQLSTVISGGGGGNYWQSGGDSQTCYGSEIKIGNVLIYEVTV